MTKRNMFLALGIFWIIIIGGFIGIKEYTLRTGEEIVLKTVPVDPRDLFRGDYVILRYVISTLNLKSLPTDLVDYKPGDTVYVALNKVDGYGVASGVYMNRPKSGLYIKGLVKSGWGSGLNVEYGIESYFVPENKGQTIPRSGVDVRVAIDKYGTALIKTIIIDGKEVRFGN